MAHCTPGLDDPLMTSSACARLHCRQTHRLPQSPVTYARQFALPFPQDAQYAPEAFLPGDANEDALAWLARPEMWPFGRLAVYGEAGAGKTHLLHLFAARARAALLPAEALRPFTALPQAAALAIDDADTVADPRALLHLLNSAAEAGMMVLLAGRSPPSQWRVGLPDLASRLRAITTVALRLPEDDLLRALLARLLAERQLVVPERVQQYLLTHLPRTGGALREAAARLDRLALASGGHVTRAMAALVADEPALEPAGDLPIADLLPNT
jgi:chromosomal replication initiation ATPase DnaA